MRSWDSLLKVAGMRLDALHKHPQLTALPQWAQQEFRCSLRVPVGEPIERRAKHFLTTPVLPALRIAATGKGTAAKVKHDARTPKWLPAHAS